MSDIQSFITALKHHPNTNTVFNPWWQIDEHHDAEDTAPKIRRRQLTDYLTQRLGKADTLLLGEALGYQGGHFSGIAMTSERLLLGHLKQHGVLPEHVLQISPARTSKESVKPLGFVEPTASIVWKFLIENRINPFRIVIWNAFPWHPYKKQEGYLSNRTPHDDELQRGEKHLRHLIEIFKFTNIIAVGEKSHQLLNAMKISNVKVRHPANGGAGLFREQMKKIITSS